MALFPQNLLSDIALIIVIATVLAYLARLFRQPLVAAYAIAGIILGPIGLSLVTDVNSIRAISDIGIIFLLFIVGLQIDLSKLRDIGLIATLGGTIQVALTFLLGFLATYTIGFTTINAVYAGLVVAFSSTMIVVKLLSDKEELNSLHGRIIVGILIMQDVLVILPLTFMALPKFSLIVIATVLLKMLALFLIVYLIRKFVISTLFNYAAKSAELLFLLSLSFCFLFAFIAYLLGFSIAIGAFIGGVTLASLPYYLNILGEIKPLKDFFATIFFVSLGMQVSVLNFSATLTPLVVLLLLTILIKPLVIMLLLSAFGYSKRTTFVTALALGQLSEFGLILVTQARGVISEELFSLTIIVAAISITLTAYFMKYYERLYELLSKPLSILDRISMNKKELHETKIKSPAQIICFGCHRMGAVIVNALIKEKKDVLVIDLNPDIVRNLKKKNVNCLYGDASNFEILKQISKKHTRLVISTVPHEEENRTLLKYVKQLNPKIMVFLTASHIHKALDLYAAGADYVIIPNVLAGERIAQLLIRGIPDRGVMKQIRSKHLKTLLSLNSQYR